MSFPKYPEYKDSGVEWIGDIPAHWITAPIKNLADVINGYPFDSKLFSPTGQHPLVRIRDLNKIETEANYDGEFLESAAITPEDVLIGMDGDFNIGRWNGQGKALLNQRMCCVRGHKDITSRLIEYALPFPLKAINDITYSTTVKHLSSYQVQKTFIALPPHEQEQSAIAAFLDRETAKIDALVAEQEKLIELLKEKRQAVISHAVTKGLDPNVPMKDSGVEWLGEVPEHWEIKRLKHVKDARLNSFVDGPFGSNLKSEHFVDDGDVYVIESNFATTGMLDQEQLKTITFSHFETILRSEAVEGDIIIAKIGAQFGKSSILPHIDKRAVVSGNTLKLTINKDICETKWVYYQLLNLKQNGEIDQLVNGSAQPALSLGVMNNLIALIPPINEQIHITSVLDGYFQKNELLIEESLRAIDLLKERRAALISAAVTGKIDVRGLAEATQ